jgi:hypothetical protein
MRRLATAAAAAALLAAAPASAGDGALAPAALLQPRFEMLQRVSTFKDSAWRRAVTGDEPCADAVALVESSVGQSSGFLVGRQRRIVLSTAHGLVSHQDGRALRRAAVRFEHTRNGPASFDATILRVGATAAFATDNAARDWAILLLDRPVPGVQALTPRYATRPDELRRLGPTLALLAYHYDFMGGSRAAVSDRCSISGRADGLALHDCDAMVGSSGGPLIHREPGRCAVVAINQGCLGRHQRNVDYRPNGPDANANRAVPLANLGDVLEPILRRLDEGDGNIGPENFTSSP